MFELRYKNLLREIRAHGDVKQGRNGVTKSIFGMTLRIDELTSGLFPVITSRKMFPKGVIGELQAFIKGPKTVKDFEDEGCNYWKLWGKPDGSITVDYGNKWLDFNGVNQLEQLLHNLEDNPYSRRHIMTSWDPGNLDNLDLPCCHWAYQFNVTSTGRLDLIWIQRSVDMLVGLPSDIVLAAVLLRLVANTVGLKPGTITMQLGDCHIYDNHNADAYLDARIHESPTYICDSGIYDKVNLELINYKHEGAIKYELNG